MMSDHIKRVVIVGGGSAGWITAGVIAADHNAKSESGIEVTLIESPDIKTIGVGEGTWPTMRETLDKIGISETDLFRECDAAFKQGAKYVNWVTGEEGDAYYHPFVVPEGYNETDLVFSWQAHKGQVAFADAVNYQGQLCESGLAPKQISTPEYAAVASYAYHLNAVKLGKLLRKHCITKLGVKHVVDHVNKINSAENGDIHFLSTKKGKTIEGDIFIDCSGFASILIDKHYKIPFISKKDILFNDCGLAVQVPYENENDPITSHTISTAQSAGWIWDIGLPTRRGVGYAYSSKHISDEDAKAELRKYIAKSIGKEKVDALDIMKILINPGHREKFWHKNCVAVGLASGFLEPLEASALVNIEMAAARISKELPATRATMDIVSKRYNQLFLYRWDRIIDFLKLHYILTRRTDTPYWVDNCDPQTIPETLKELMKLWRHHPPSNRDFVHVEEVFPSSSWQYILYGMGFETAKPVTERRSINDELAQQYFQKNIKTGNKYLAALPKNRELINKINEYGMQKI